MECSLFRGLRESEIQRAIGEIHHQLREYEPGDTIVVMNDQCETLLIVTQGTVVAEMTHFDGRSIRIEEIHALSSLAEAFVFGHHNRYPVTVTALSHSTVLSIHRDELLKLFASNVTMLRNYLDSISNRTQLLTEKIRFLSFKTIKGKIASYILKLDGVEKGLVNLPQTQENLAGYFGVARPSLARAMGELQDEGAITVNRREVKIVDKAILLAYLDE